MRIKIDSLTLTMEELDVTNQVTEDENSELSTSEGTIQSSKLLNWKTFLNLIRRN